MRSMKFIGAFILAHCLLSAAGAQERLDHLKGWVGKYPTYNDTKPHREFLKLPEVRQRLLKLVSKKDYRFITVTCGKEVPIEQIEDYLIIRKCHSNYCLRGTALIILNIRDGGMHVAINGEGDSAPRWFSSSGNYRELPFEVQSGWIISRRRA
jgi:hypothetical protein